MSNRNYIETESARIIDAIDLLDELAYSSDDPSDYLAILDIVQRCVLARAVACREFHAETKRGLGYSDND